MKFSLLDSIILIEDLPEEGLLSGMIGAIVDIYTTPNEAYEVEFCDQSGKTITMLALSVNQIRKYQRFT